MKEPTLQRGKKYTKKAQNFREEHIGKEKKYTSLLTRVLIYTYAAEELLYSEDILVLTKTCGRNGEILYHIHT